MNPAPSVPELLAAVDLAIKAVLARVADIDPGFTEPAKISVVKQLAGMAEVTGELLAEAER